jgi:hypothetical protein
VRLRPVVPARPRPEAPVRGGCEIAGGVFRLAVGIVAERPTGADVHGIGTDQADPQQSLAFLRLPDRVEPLVSLS